MIRRLIVFFFVINNINQVVSQDNAIIMGTKHTLYSNILHEDREYWISLPDSYYDEGASYKNYPLLVVLDGNLHFKTVASMVNYMGADMYRSRKIPEMIVVGIKNVDRRRDYTPDKIVTVRKNNSGGGEDFLRFLEVELIPQLDKTYRTDSYRILFGHSLSGLLAVHAYMKPETRFNAFIAADPSFGTWDATTMDQKLEKVTKKSFQRYLYIATANWGKRNIGNRDRHVRLFESLNSKYKGAFHAKLEYYEKENHSSVPPIAFYNGISAIFEGYGISYRNIDSLEQLIQNYKALSTRLTWDFAPPEALVNQIGYNMLPTDKQKALEFFMLNTKNYPNSYNAFDSLGEAYEAVEDPQKAMESYKKSI